MRGFVRRYGAHPLHLIVLIGCFALAGYAALGLISEHAIAVVVWFVGAAVLHPTMRTLTEPQRVSILPGFHRGNAP